MVTADEILAALRAEFDLLPDPADAGRRAGRDLAGRRVHRRHPASRPGSA